MPKKPKPHQDYRLKWPLAEVEIPDHVHIIDPEKATFHKETGTKPINGWKFNPLKDVLVSYRINLVHYSPRNRLLHIKAFYGRVLLWALKKRPWYQFWGILAALSTFAIAVITVWDFFK